MYWRLALAHAPELADEVVAPLVAVALDADRPQPERVLALHRLRGARAQRRVISRRLVPVLNEPLLWLGSEAHACLAQLDDSLALGVDGNGLIAASPEAEEALARDGDGQRHCPRLGPVEALPHAGVLRRRLAAPPPWLCAPPHGGVLFALRRGGEFVRRVYVGADCTLGAGSFTARLPAQTKVSVEVRLREGTAAIAKGYAGLAPTKNGAPLEDGAATIEPGDVVGMVPFELVVCEIVPSRADGVSAADPSIHGISLASYPHVLALGQALAWTAKGTAGERRGHVANIGAMRVGLVEEAEVARVLPVQMHEALDVEGVPVARPR